jgi:hypothetical protein
LCADGEQNSGPAGYLVETSNVKKDCVVVQTDKRNLAQKAMLQDIKDVAEKRRADDHNVYLSTTNFAARLMPDLTFHDNHRWHIILPSILLSQGARVIASITNSHDGTHCVPKRPIDPLVYDQHVPLRQVPCRFLKHRVGQSGTAKPPMVAVEGTSGSQKDLLLLAI